MRVGTLYAVLRLNTGAFDAALANSASRWTQFTAALRAGAFIATEAFGAAIVGSILAATNFQDHMTKATAIMGDLSDAIRTKMGDAAREVAKTTLFSASQAADAFYYLASAGYDAQQSIALLPQVALFAQAGLLNLEDATRMLAQIQTTLGLRTGDAAQDMLNMARISDVLTEAANESLGTIEGFADALARQAGPALRLVNKSVEEGVAILAVFADQGIVGARAGTALAIVLRDLQTKAIKNKEVFAQFGVSVFDASGKMRDTADIIADLEHALAGMSDEQKKATLLELGFTDRSVGFILALVGQSKALREYEKNLAAAGGTTKEVAERQMASLASQLTLLWHVVTDVGIAIGQKLIPGITDTVRGLREWLNANEDLVVSIVVGLMNAIGDVASFIFGNLGPAFGFVGDKIGIAVDKIHEFQAAWQEVFGTGGMPTPGTGASGKLKGLLADLTEAGDPLYGVSQRVRDLLELVDNAPAKVNPFLGALQALKDKLDLVLPVITPIIDKLQEYNVLGLILAGTITGILGAALIALAGWLLPFVAIATLVVGGTLAISEAWKAWGDDISGAVGDALQWLGTNVLPDILRAAEGIGDWVSDHKDEILEFLGNLGDAGKVAFDLITEAIQRGWPILVAIGEVVLPAIGVAAEKLLDVINWTFKQIGEKWDAAAKIADDLGIKFDALGPIIGALSAILDAFIILVTVRLALAFAGWALSLVGLSVSMSITMVAAIGRLVLAIGVGSIAGGTGLIGALAGIAAVIGPVGVIVLAGIALWTTNMGGFRTMIQGAITDMTDLSKTFDFNGINPLDPGAFFGGPTGDNGFLGLFPPTSGGSTYNPYGSKVSTYPTFATGTPWFGGGWAMVGEQGPELLNLPRGSRVFPTDESERMMAGRGSAEYHTHLHVDGLIQAKDEYDVVRQLRRAARSMPYDPTAIPVTTSG